jgi:RNA polymerase sigma factor (sigma-70 family)
MVDWQAILAEHGSIVWRTIFRLLDHHADAADCYQETFLAAYETANRESISCWRSFLTSLAARRAIDRLRARIRMRRRFTSLHGISEPVAANASPSEEAAGHDLLDQVRNLLAELPDKQADVFWLSCIEGLSHQEISEHLHISNGAVRVLLHRARACLKTALGPAFLDERKDR